MKEILSQFSKYIKGALLFITNRYTSQISQLFEGETAFGHTYPLFYSSSTVFVLIVNNVVFIA
jgi:hypothetical protein